MELVSSNSRADCEEALRRWKIVQGMFDDFRGSDFMDMGIQQQLVLQKIGKREATKKFLPIINCLFSIFQCATILIIMINIFYPSAISLFLFRFD